MTRNTMVFMGVDGIPFTVSAFNPSAAAVGTYLPMDPSEIATINSPRELIVPKDCYLTDFIAGAATGVIGINANGFDKNIHIDYASRQPSIAHRPALNVPIRAGTTLRLKVIVALPT